MYRTARLQKPADRLFEQHSVPQPSHTGSDALEFSALTTFNRDAVLSKFLPSFDDFGRPVANRKRTPGAAAAAAAAAEVGSANAGAVKSDASKPRAQDNTSRILYATRQDSSAERLEQFRQRAREEERLHRTARRERSKVDGLWDAASRVVRHRRQEVPAHLMSSKRREAQRRAESNGASRSEVKRRATAALIADPPLSLIKEGLEAGYTNQLSQIFARVPEAFMQQLRGVFAAHDDDNDGLLTIDQLRRAVLGLGLSDTPDTLERFVKLSKHKPLVDVVSFVYVVAMLGDGAASRPDDCALEVLEVLETVRAWVTASEGGQSKPNSAGHRELKQSQPPASANDPLVANIDSDMLRHVLRVHTGTQLSSNEVDDFMVYAETLLQAKQTQRQKTALNNTLSQPPIVSDESTGQKKLSLDQLIHHLVDYRSSDSPFIIE